MLLIIIEVRQIVESIFHSLCESSSTNNTFSYFQASEFLQISGCLYSWSSLLPQRRTFFF